MPAHDLWWVDAEVEDLGWSRGVVQLGHHSYDPHGPHPVGGCVFRYQPCAPTTWHWDSVEIAPAVPFTLLPAAPRRVDEASGGAITLPSPVPPGGFLRFLAVGRQMEVSFDGGGTWQPAGARRGDLDPAARPAVAAGGWRPGAALDGSQPLGLGPAIVGAAGGRPHWSAAPDAIHSTAARISGAMWSASRFVMAFSIDSAGSPRSSGRGADVKPAH